MNQTELIARVRRNAFIPTNHPTYTDQIILDELNDALRSIYEDLVTIPRQGHWLKQYTFSTVIGQQSYRISPRAVVGGIENIAIGIPSGQLQLIDQVTENHALIYESYAGQTGSPFYYCIRGDTVDFLPTPNSVMTVRVSYYIRPSVLTLPQPIPESPSSGTISTVNTGTRQVTVTAVPVFRTSGVNWTSGSPINAGIPVDIVHADGTFELALVGVAPSNFSSFTYTFPVGTDLSDVVSASTSSYPDRLRAQCETDFPPLPEEFHRTVADTASVKIMLQLNMNAKAQGIASSVGGDLERMRKLIEAPRTRRQPKRVLAQLTTRGGNLPWSRWK